MSGSRDTLIHVYDACDGFRLLETLDEHEAEVTAVRFTCGGKGLVSCGADHSIIFRCAGQGTHACRLLVFLPIKSAAMAVECCEGTAHSS